MSAAADLSSNPIGTTRSSSQNNGGDSISSSCPTSRGSHSRSNQKPQAATGQSHAQKKPAPRGYHRAESNNSNSVRGMMDSRFSCNICLDAVEEPVVTQCGHLYCWPCLFRWLEPGMTISERQSLHLALAVLDNHDASRRHCPVCKAPCCVSSLIPIYVRSSSGQSVVGTQSSCGSVVGGNAPVATTDDSKHSLEDNNTQHETSLPPQPRADEETREDSYAVAQRNQSEANLSEIDKNSSASTIATEQEEEEDDGVGTDTLETPILVSSAHNNNEGASEQGASSSNRALHPAPPAAALGALQRQRRASPSPPVSSTLLVPNQDENMSPGAGGDHRPRSLSENAVGVLQQQQQATAASRTLALSQGLALTLHRALQPTGSTNSTAQAAAQAAASIVVPPLHRPEGFGNAAAMNTSLQQEADPDATEFLSRVLLMLGSFVILCFLLF